MSSSIAATAGGSGGSTSMVSGELATGWHVLKVQGYSQYRAVGAAGKVVKSGRFTVGGHSWCVLYFPNGYPGEENAGWVGFGLQLDGGGDGGGVTAQYKLRLLDKDGEPLLRLMPYTRVSDLHHFSTRGNPWGYIGKFITIGAFNSLYLEADCFRIRCDVTVVLETRDESPELHRHLGNLLATGVGGDVMFEVGKETFVAHMIVLAARSPVFMAKFFGGKQMEERQAATAHVRILGINAKAFKAMLHFIYTDSLPEIDDDDKIVVAQHLLVAADRYGLERLKPICENKLCILVNASVVVSTLKLAVKHGCRRLKQACFKVLKHGDNFKALGYDEYNYLVRSCPSLLNKFLAEQGL